MSQMSADPLRNVALSEVLPVDPAALRSARRGEFENALSRAQQQRESPPLERPIAQGEPAESTDRSRGRPTETTSPSGSASESPAQSTMAEDERPAEEEESEVGEQAAAAPAEACDQSAAPVADDAALIVGEGVVEGSGVAAPPDSEIEVAVATPTGDSLPAEGRSADGAAQPQRDAAGLGVAAGAPEGAEQQPLAPVEAQPQGPASLSSASAALKQENRTKAETGEEAGDSGEEHRGRPTELGSTKTETKAEADVEALRPPTGDGWNLRRAGDATPVGGGPRRSAAGADSRTGGARRPRLADQPASAPPVAAQVAAADAPTESAATIAPLASAAAGNTAPTAPIAQAAVLPMVEVPGAAPAAIGIRPAAVRTTAVDAANVEETPGRDAGAGIDRARFVHRVAGALRSMSEQNHTLRLRLSPPELGSLRIEITVRNGQMSARFEAETPEAKNLLLDHLPALKERLAGQEIKIQQFHVEVADRQPGGGTQHAGQEESRRREARAATAGGSARGKPAEPVGETARQPRLGGDGRLNVIV